MLRGANVVPSEAKAQVRLPLVILAIDRLNDLIGRAAAWLMLPVVFIGFAVVVLRYGFGFGLLWMQELYVWLHGLAFMLAGGYALARGAHVRVDILYRSAKPRARAWINILGVIFLLGVSMAVLFLVSYPQIARAWAIREASMNVDGIPFVYLLKTAIPVFCVLALLQGLSLFTKSLYVLLGHEAIIAEMDPDMHASAGEGDER